MRIVAQQPVDSFNQISVLLNPRTMQLNMLIKRDLKRNGIWSEQITGPFESIGELRRALDSVMNEIRVHQSVVQAKH